MKELCVLEGELLKVLEFNLYVQEEEYIKYFEYLTEMKKNII